MDISIKPKGKIKNPAVDAMVLGSALLTILSIVLIGTSLVDKTTNVGVLAITILANIFVWAMAILISTTEQHKELKKLIEGKT